MSFLTLLLLLLTISLAFFSTSSATDSPTVYRVLESYGFPQGLLPLGVTGYKLDSATGKFSVSMDKSCSFTIHGYDLKYKTTISGTISENKITNLKGIQVRLLILWVNIIEVTNNGEDLEFSVGIISAGFPVHSFYECPQCGCGFHCNGGRSDRRFTLKNLLPLLEI